MEDIFEFLYIVIRQPFQFYCDAVNLFGNNVVPVGLAFKIGRTRTVLSVRLITNFGEKSLRVFYPVSYES